MHDVYEQLETSLNSLKDFQSATVVSVLENFYSHRSDRVMVADEVGLGKTVVAKGVIAEMLKRHLEATGDSEIVSPFRVTYICSNLTLAEENRKKLAIFRGKTKNKYVQEPSFGRLAELAIRKHTLEETKSGKLLELCSLTPSTSFSLTDGDGNKKERAIVSLVLLKHSLLKRYETELSNFFCNDVKNWDELLKRLQEEYAIDVSVKQDFFDLLSEPIGQSVLQHCGIEEAYGTWLDALIGYLNKNFKFTKPAYATRFRSKIRQLLAHACAKHITADLFILDEFQRFKMLLDSNNENEESLIAREVLKARENTRILLLSATPFKAVSQAKDDEEGDAHAEELRFLLNFLTKGKTQLLYEYESHRKALQLQLLSLKDERVEVSALTGEHKIIIESLLRQVMARTERVQISQNYERFFSLNHKVCLDEFSYEEVKVFKAIDQLGLAIQEVSPNSHSSHLMEFYKAAPWPLSFLSGYSFKKLLDDYKDIKEVKAALRESNSAWLAREAINNYQLDLAKSPHAKTRSLVNELFKTPSEKLLWVPPTRPYYPLEGAFKGQEQFTKTLLFSSWAMVPRALSGLVSYEAERRLVNKAQNTKYYSSEKHNPNIRFDESSSLIGWALVYPTICLTELTQMPQAVSLSSLIEERTQYFKDELQKLKQFQRGATRGIRWYSLAPFLLDICNGNEEIVEEWLTARMLQAKSQAKNERDSGAAKQLFKLRDEVLKSAGLELGPMPKNLAEYLSYLSVAGLGVVVYRSWSNLWPSESRKNCMDAATSAAISAISMFNKPTSEAILNKQFPRMRSSNDYYWKILRYSADGDLQSVIDEYGHLMKDAGLPMIDASDNSGSATSRLSEVFGMQTTSVACQYREDKNKHDDQLKRKDSNVSAARHSLRCHYAVPLGNQRMSDESGLQRIGHIRDAFNSPFRPFVLNSTSIGQEGLDFHWYCHHIVHWNIPSNPIDIEQREGRINRYKSLVVRKRVVENYAHQLGYNSSNDLWAELFSIAEKLTGLEGRQSDLVPYWHVEQGQSQIERFVPLLPMSRDKLRLQHALKILAMYRLAFGQPRQEDLLNNIIQRNFNESEMEEIKSKLVINLTAFKAKNK